MATDFKKIANIAAKQGVGLNDSLKSREWFRTAVQHTGAARRVTPENVIKNAEPFETLQRLSINSIGKLYLFRYHPKYEKELPYYDLFPLVFPIEFYNNGFLGINLHYLPLRYRASLMDGLYDLINNDKMDKTTSLRISYRILKGASGLSEFEPCVKRYLFTHIASPFLYVKPVYWDMALFLPLDRFQKKSSSYVHEQSVRKIRR